MPGCSFQPQNVRRRTGEKIVPPVMAPIRYPFADAGVNIGKRGVGTTFPKSDWEVI
jgi:hypothetical protein